MKQTSVLILLISLLIPIGCNNSEGKIYTSPSDSQILDYISTNELIIQDSIWIQKSAVLLLENSLITLYADQSENLYDHKLYWSSDRSPEPTVIGNGNPYLGLVLNKDLKDEGASQIIIRYLNGKTIQRGITKQSGYLFSNPGENELESLIILDVEGKELYKHRE